MQQIEGGYYQQWNQQVGELSNRPVQGPFFGADKVWLHNQHQAPENEGDAVGMHAVIFLLKYFYKIGEPKPPKHEKEENKEIQMAALDQGFF